MITKWEYEALLDQSKKANRENDYSKMIMVGDDNHKKMQEYEREFVCKHESIEEIQGGQIERCRHCGKTWG
jgi:hypothetical protein